MALMKLTLPLALLLLVPATAAAQPTPALAPPPTPDEEPAGSLRYDKGFILTSGDGEFEMKAGLRTQVRYELGLVDNEGVDDETVSRFSLPRVRLQLEGHAYGKPNTYKMEFDVANKGSAVLKDFWVDHAFASDVHVRGGQWKQPFSRHEIVSDYASWFNERSIANEFVETGRDLGAAVHNNYEKSPEGIEWVAGVFNGTGKPDKPVQSLSCDDPSDPEGCAVGTPSNVPGDWDPALIARVGFNHGGIKGYSEADLEGGPLRIAAGVGYRLNLNNFQKDPADDGLLLDHGATADFLLKVEGFDVQGAVYLLKKGEADAELAYLGQAGYMVVPKKVGLAGRFGFRPDPAIADEDILEMLAAADWFMSGHAAKLMLDGGLLQSTADGGPLALQVRTTMQLTF